MHETLIVWIIQAFRVIKSLLLVEWVIRLLKVITDLLRQRPEGWGDPEKHMTCVTNLRFAVSAAIAL